MNRINFQNFFLTISLTLSNPQCLTASNAVPATNDQLIGSWVGYDDVSANYFCRLELGSDGKGLLVLLLNSELKALSVLDDWRMQGYELVLKDRPRNRRSKGFEFYTRSASSRMIIVRVRQVRTDEVTEITLRRESGFDGHIECDDLCRGHQNEIEEQFAGTGSVKRST